MKLKGYPSSKFGRIKRDDSATQSKAALSTQETYINDEHNTTDVYATNLTQTEELLKSVGLGSLIRPMKPKHRRNDTEISDLSQFGDIDEEVTDEEPISKNMYTHSNRIIKKSPLPTVADTQYGEILKVRKKGRDKSIDWFSSKFEIPAASSKQKDIPTLVEEETSYDDLNDYMPTEQYDGGFNMKLHPHCLTGAKGLDTSYNLENLDNSSEFEENEENEEFEDLLAVGNLHFHDAQFRDSDKLEVISHLSDQSEEVQKLALYTDEDENLPQKPESSSKGACKSRISLVNIQNRENAEIALNAQDFEAVLQESPPKIIPINEAKRTELENLDDEILITQESNEYELEECNIFDQGNNDHKVYQCLLRNGKLLKKQKLNKKKTIGSTRTSIKSAYSSLSSLSLYGSGSFSKSKQRSSTLLKNKVKEIKSKMSGKKTHTRNKSRNLEDTLTKKTSRKNALESIPEYSKKLKSIYLKN
ncbi:unnamed protein product [Moneuplotes crassus]|uniref:Uncharacterized protein n=1 Tax=Euplotes crassus TaxID=5936 RepID=A0AAD1XAW9_EUPCR|nr:unnamed protein product [Moneuplotes crassus]